MTTEEKALALVKRALDYADSMICPHDNRERGGVIWTICQDCGAKWADDEGGFKPSPWPEMLEAALDDAEAAIEAHEAFKREVSEAVKRYVQFAEGAFHNGSVGYDAAQKLRSFIIPEADPLVEVFRSLPLDGDAGCDKLTDAEWAKVAEAARLAIATKEAV